MPANLNKGFGIIKVSKLPNGNFEASVEGLGKVEEATESKAILSINTKMKEEIEKSEASLPFRILS